jgi:RNA recognition motif-containing protein
MKRLFVGNLLYQVTEEDLREVFAQHGEVADVKVIRDRETQQSKGFAFVDMSDDAQASAAISHLHGADWGGRAMVVNEARPRDFGRK